MGSSPTRPTCSQRQRRAVVGVTAAAETLYVHPNTFRYRLRRPADVGDIDLDHPDQRVVVTLQLRTFEPRTPGSLQRMPTTLEFVGTATTVLRLGQLTFLTDPNFLHRGQRAYLGKGLFSKRLTEPSLQVDQLPQLDAVLLSHLHGDHFDRIARDRLDRELPVLTTPAASRKLSSWGFRGAYGMSTWESSGFGNGGTSLTVTSVPGRHAPGAFQRVLPPVMGSVLELHEGDADPFRVYVTGDTLRYPWLREVAERCGPIDAMIIHLGGTRILGLLVTMDGAQGADLVELIRPRLTVPIHNDDYTVFRSPLEDFLTACRDRDAPTRIQPVTRGEVVQLTPSDG